MKNSNPENKCFAILALCFFAVLFFSIDYAYPIDKAYAEDNVLDKKFKSLGIIKLAGIAPPASHDLMDIDGNPAKLSDFQGKIVFLNFWTTWCPDCVDEMPDIEKLHQKIKSKEFIIIAVDLKESKKKVKKFIKKHTLTYKILLDKKGDMGRVFGIRSIPTTFILNRQGGLIGKAMGARNWDSRKSLDLFEYLLETY
ncbi:TlpA disulfide reductase family protein [Desulfobacula sp.]|uniref:TlpA family protein disulfide reductase n=1 Tax=Desulfobacula sp. TaxID=2593537 RepID=UPI0026229ED3|nr:TlpA disulfide reductase family protein [Desulfobacula sp.]